MKKTVCFITLLLFLVSNLSVTAQDFSNKGKDFWVGYGYHQVMVSGGNNNNAQDMVLYFATDAITTVTVEIPLLNYTRTYAGIAANTIFESEPIPKSGFEDARLLDEGISRNGIHITSNKPIVAYAHIYNQSVSGATLLFPTSTLGKEYYSVNYEQTSNVDDANCWVYAVAVDPGITTVEVIPSAATLTHAANTAFTVNLEQGQILNLMGALTGNTGSAFTGVDLTGTKIRSVTGANGGCKRIAVFSGSGRIGVRCNNSNFSSDNYIVQAFPKSAWGKKYLTVPTQILPNNFFRVCVSDPTTVVKVDGVPLTGLIRGFYYQFSTTNPSVIEASAPVMVAQVMTSQGHCGNGSPGDPEVIYLSSVEQNINKVIFNSTSRFNITQHWINVVMKASAVASFRLDGAPVTPLFFNHLQEPGYMYAQIGVGAGQHTLSADSGFNAIAYGLGNFESYGYNAGTNVKDLYQFVSIQNQFATVNFPASCVNTPFYFSMTFPYQPTQIKWQFNGLFQDVTVNNPTPDSTWIVNGRQLFRYKLSNAYTTAAAGTFPIKVIAQSPASDGCGNEQEINYDLQIFAQPVADFNLLTNGCVSTPVSFTDISNTGGRTVTKWSWDFGDASNSTIQNPAHLYSTAGAYTAKLRVITDIGCVSNAAEKPVNLTQSPTALFSATGPFCQNNAITFTDSSSTPALSIVKWFWNFGDGSPLLTSATGVAQAHTYVTSGTYNVTLQVETSNGCKSGIYTRPVVIDPKPIALFTFANGCLPNASVQFTDASTINGVTGSFTYLWDFGDGSANSAVQNPTHVYTTAGPFNVALRVTSTGGCIDDTVRSVATIFAQPVAVFNLDNPESCLGKAVTFTSNSSIAQGSTVTGWLWTFDDGTTQNTSVATKTFSTAGTHSFNLKVTSAIGCESAISQGTIIVNPLPSARFALGSALCEGKDIIFNDASVANTGALIKWTWDMGDGSAPTLRTPPFTYKYAAAGSYKIVLFTETDKGCVSANFDSTILVSSVPVVAFSLPENCVNDPVSQFTDSSIVMNGAITAWLWNFGDPNATATNPNSAQSQNGSHHYTQATNYNVTLTATSDKGCVGTKTELFTINGSIPNSNFAVVNSANACVNKSVNIVGNSGVDVGKIVKLEIFWDDVNDPFNKTLDDNPEAGEIYKFNYPIFFAPVTKTYNIRVRAYSGNTCFDDLTITVTLNSSPQIIFTAPGSVCLDSSAFQLNAAVNNIAGTGIYSGRGVSASGKFDPVNAGAGTHIIRYTFISATGCSEYMEQTIIVSPVPFVDAGSSAPLGVLEGGSVTIPATATGSGLKYLWTPSIWLNSTTILRPVATPLRDTIYTLTVTNSGGCKASDRVLVEVLKGITIPNVFTPNGDGINDKWEITYLESYRGAIIQLYNRYGQLIFQSKGYDKPWDGTINGSPVPFGTYYYVIDPKNGRKSVTGFVDIIR